MMGSTLKQYGRWRMYDVGGKLLSGIKSMYDNSIDCQGKMG